MKYRIQKIKKTLTIADAGTTGSATIEINGILRTVAVNIPALTGSVTSTLNLIDDDAFTIYSKGSLAHNAKTVESPTVPPAIAGQACTLQIVAGGAQTGAKNITVVLYVERRS
jgi:hypothetical protein